MCVLCVLFVCVCLGIREGIYILTTVSLDIDLNCENSCFILFYECSCFNFHIGDFLGIFYLLFTINFIKTFAPIDLEVDRNKKNYRPANSSSPLSVPFISIFLQFNQSFINNFHLIHYNILNTYWRTTG